MTSPFVRGEAHAHDPGLGIGLHTLAEIAAVHHGRTWVQDRPGGGASFRLLLPTRSNTDRGIAAPSWQPSPEEGPCRHPG